jgi:[ribosomal protein S5]-alanine N-acetyltransferase
MLGMESWGDPGEPADLLTSQRLVLRPLRWDAVEAIIEGRRLADWAPDYPAGGDVVIARVLHRGGQPRADGPAGPWCHRQVVERTSDLVVGGIGFFGPPDDGTVEIGYGIVPSRQGRGYATEAVTEMLSLAWSDPHVAAVSAETDADNVASQRVLEKAGFDRLPSGEELRFIARRPSPS